MQRSSGTLRSRLIAPTSTLTNRKIDSYILAGRYGTELQNKLKKKLKKKKKTKKPNEQTVHKNSLALRSLQTFL